MVKKMNRFAHWLGSSPQGRSVLGYLRLGRILLTNLSQKKVSTLAHSLAFSTILSLVPILAIFFSILGTITKNINIRNDIFAFISRYFIPAYAEGIFDQLEELTRKSLALGVIGFPALFLAGVLLYMKVDDSINLIWDASRDRKWFHNSLAFFMSLFFGPMLLILLFSIPPYLQSLPYYKELMRNPVAMGALTQALPFLVSTLGLWVLYIYIPNVRVGAYSALTGAVFSAFLIQGANALLGYYFAHLGRFDLFYGSLVTVPVFLIWVYVLWLVVLSGAAVSYITQHTAHKTELIAQNIYTDESLLCNALESLLALAKAFEDGEGSLDLDQLHFRLGLHKKLLVLIMNRLEQEGFAVKVEPNKKHFADCYQLAQAAKNIDIGRIVPLFFTAKAHQAFGPELANLLNNLSVHPAFTANKTNLQELLDRASAPHPL